MCVVLCVRVCVTCFYFYFSKLCEFVYYRLVLPVSCIIFLFKFFLLFFFSKKVFLRVECKAVPYLRVLGDKRFKLCLVSPAHFVHFLSPFVDLEGWHGRDSCIRRDGFEFVDVHHEEGD